MERITSLNNEAIMLFQVGRHDQALDVLMNLLTCLRTILSPARDEKTDRDDDEVGKLESPLYSAESLPDLPGGSNFVYNKVFKVAVTEQKVDGRESNHKATTSIDLEDACTDNKKFETNQIFTACVIYNLAIIHQNLGIISGKSLPHLEKAERLYQMCLKILQSLDSGRRAMVAASSRTTILIHVIKAVSYNNLAQLYAEKPGCEEQAKSCLVNLCNLVPVLVHGSEQADALFSDDEYIGIIDTVLMLQPPTMAAAA